MRTRTTRFLALLLGLSVLTPSSSSAGDGEMLGLILGATTGGLLGSQAGRGGGQVAFTSLGVISGGLVGATLGQSWDRGGRRDGYGDSHRGHRWASSPYDAPWRFQTPYEPLYVGPSRVFAPRPTYVSTYVPPPPVFDLPSQAPVYIREGYVGPRPEQYCREFTQTVRINGTIQESYGTACLQPDGRWLVEP